MSERWLVLVLAVALATPATPAGGQTAAEWRRKLDSATVASARADSDFVRIREAAALERTAHLVAGERRVLYSPKQITATDSARIARGLEGGRARLIARFGANSTQLLDSANWLLTSSLDGRSYLTEVRLMTSEGAFRATVDLRRPIDPRKVEEFVLGVAGDGLPHLAPGLIRHASGAVSLVDDPDRFVLAGREMALSWSSAARRCITGALVACRAALTVAEPSERLSHYFEPSDWRAVVGASGSPTDADSLYFVDRRSCLVGEQAACARIISRGVVPLPISSSARATLVMHALDLGGLHAIERLVASRDEDPIALLAAVAGVPEDSLLASWQRRTVSALYSVQGNRLPLVLSVAGWGALVLVGATRRRP